MQRIISCLMTGVLVLGTCILVPGTASAAESYDGCAGTITSLPATITKQGVWCLKKSFSTNLSSGAAITISVNNVTLECNDFNIDGAGTDANGIAGNVQSATIRNCGIRGFDNGIHLQGAGHVVQNNFLERNRTSGITVQAVNSQVVGNRVFNTLGGGSAFAGAYGIRSHGDVIDNIVSGLNSGASTTAVGIHVTGDGLEISGNTVRGFVLATGARARGIHPRGKRIKVRGNHVVSASSKSNPASVVDQYGIWAGGGTNTFCSENTVSGFTTNIDSCTSFAGPGFAGG